MKFKDLANEAKMAFKDTDNEKVSSVSARIGQYLMEVYGDMQTNNLNDEELKAFEICALTLEFSTLHLGKDQRFIFILLELIGNDERLEQLRQRLRLIDIPNQVSNIEQDWKLFSERSMKEIEKLKGLRSALLNDESSDLFYKRAGTKVVSQFQKMLERINSKETFVPYLLKMLMENSVVDRSIVPEVLSMTTSEVTSDLTVDIFA